MHLPTETEDSAVHPQFESAGDTCLLFELLHDGLCQLSNPTHTLLSLTFMSWGQVQAVDVSMSCFIYKNLHIDYTTSVVVMCVFYLVIQGHGNKLNCFYTPPCSFYNGSLI